jgi:LytS/YehU family sensor histidine kinase
MIEPAPERALGTLMRLSGLLRGRLRAGEEVVTIGEELNLIEAYLDIERARL